MFTGIVDHQATVVSHSVKGAGIQLFLQSSFQSIRLGESISVNGVCLTVVAEDKGLVTFDISPETLSLTNLGELFVDARVNVERAVAAQDLMGGHWVSGHADGQLILLRREAVGEYIQFDFSVPQESWLDLLVEKGSVAINGVSLTVNSIASDVLRVMCIPHTLEVTTLDTLAVGDRVNVEFDMVAKMLQKNISRYLDKYKMDNTSKEERV
jgi:riboflavin synthase